MDAADIAVLYLRLLGQDVIQVYDGDSALEVAREFIPEIVVLDMMMPGLNGAEVAKAIRALPPPVRDCRIVAYTGFSHQETRQAAEEAGINDFLVKPVPQQRWLELLATLA